MKVCFLLPAVLRHAIGKRPGSGLWMHSVLRLPSIMGLRSWLRLIDDWLTQPKEWDS
jgi:hypothetical protein